MGTMKIILKEDIASLGEEGDIKVVKRGYANNYLFPKGLAVDYSIQNRNLLERQKDAIEKKRLQKRENASALKDKLAKEKVVIEIAAGEKGRLYGTVTTSQIVDDLNGKGYSFDKKNIVLKEHIKFGGSYKFKIHLYHDIYAEIELEVIAKQEEKKVRNPKKPRKRDEAQVTDETVEETPGTEDDAAVEANAETPGEEEAPQEEE